MAEATEQETPVEKITESQESGAQAAETPTSNRPSPFAFAGFLLGSWFVLMIVFVVFAAVAMTIVGGILG
jgi:hypothetical protein